MKQWAPLGIFALNLLIGWRLLNQDYSAHYDSIEPFFYALADYLKSNWLHPGWWKEWNCGMPFRYTYQPLLHHVVAAVAVLAHWSSARAFHFTLGIFYAAGPVTLYLLVLRLSRSARVALTSALLYSIWSPSAWLMPDVAADIDGLFHARRLHTAVIYGDGPYVAGLTLVPLALLFIHRASRKASPVNVFLAAAATVAVPLTNVPAAMSLAMMLLAYWLTAEPDERIPRLRAIGISSVLGYLLAAPLLPPSEFALIAKNTQWMDPAATMSPMKGALVAMGAVLFYAMAQALRRLSVNQFARFSIVFTLITGAIVLGKNWGGFSVIAQPTRFHLAMEMAIVMAIGSCAAFVRVQRRATAACLIAAAGAAMIHQLVEFRLYARKIVERKPVYERSEYKISRWLDRNAGGQRVMVPGSVSFWLNAFTTTPQMTGCCDQSLLFQAPRIAVYEIGTDDGAGRDAAAISILWLQTLGVKFVALSGPGSTETYHVTHHPHKFDGVLPKRWQHDDDAIFEVPGDGSLAHWIARSEAVSAMPVNGIDIAPLRPYAAAVSSANRPPAAFSWKDSATALIHGRPQPGDVLSIQIPFHPGWRAEDSAGKAIHVGRDALGLMLLDPGCRGDCAVTLTFDGGLEAKLLRALALLTWLGAIYYGCYGPSGLLNRNSGRRRGARDE